MGKKGSKVSRGLASAGIIGLLFGVGSTSGVPKKTADFGSSLYRAGANQQRRQQSRAVRNGTTDSAGRRRGTNQR